METINELIGTGSYEIVGGDSKSVILAPKTTGRYMDAINLIASADRIIEKNGARRLPVNSFTRVRIAR